MDVCMNTFDILMIGLTLSLIFIFPLALRWVKRARDEAAAEVRELVGEENILLCDLSANFNGAASEGMFQLRRGDGCLALTKTSLLFMWLLSRETIEIPVSHLRGVERVPDAITKKGRALMRIHIRDESGADETFSFYVERVAAWVASIERLIQTDNATTRGLDADSERGALPTDVPAEDSVLW